MLSRRILFIFLVIPAILLLSVKAVQAQENNGSEQITNFQTTIQLNENGSFVVQETIVYNFGVLERHGIYRDIPYKYTRQGTTYKVRLKVLSVADEQGRGWKFSTSRSGGELHLKIGDPDVLVSGVKTYIIAYRVERAINYFSDHDELYWNVTGNAWIVPIQQSSASLQSPTALEEKQWQLACYTGSLGSQEQHCASAVVGDRTVTFTTSQALASSEGLTIVAGLPKGIIQKPELDRQIGWFLADNWSVAVPFVVLFIMYYLWYTRGRDPKGKNTVIPIYESPDRLPAAEIGVIVDEKADVKDLSSTIIQLAVKGFLKIKEIEKKKLFGKDKDYEFIKLKEADATLRDYEKKIFQALFDSQPTRTVSDLKNKFYKHLKDIKDSLYQAVVDDGYFPTSPEGVRNLYLGVAVAVIAIGGALLFFARHTVGGLGTIFSGVIAGIFAGKMPRKTLKGTETHGQILGFKWFLSVTEAERLKFHNAPAKSPKEFEDLLPYAMVLGVEKEWAKQFADMYITPPEWYEGQLGTAFGAYYLAISLGSLSSSANSAMVTAPSRSSTAGFGGSGFGGGGFSGGGFGGGGGGSW